MSDVLKLMLKYGIPGFLIVLGSLLALFLLPEITLLTCGILFFAMGVGAACLFTSLFFMFTYCCCNITHVRVYPDTTIPVAPPLESKPIENRFIPKNGGPSQLYPAQSQPMVIAKPQFEKTGTTPSPNNSLQTVGLTNSPPEGTVIYAPSSSPT